MFKTQMAIQSLKKSTKSEHNLCYELFKISTTMRMTFLIIRTGIVNTVAFCKFFPPDNLLPIFHLNYKVTKKCFFFFCSVVYVTVIQLRLKINVL